MPPKPSNVNILIDESDPQSSPCIHHARPRYHQNAPSSEPSHLPDPGGPSMFSGDIEEELAAGGGNVSSLTSPKAVKEPFVVQYPLYARDLDQISVEQKLSQHVCRQAAAVQHWNRDVIPGLIHLYMEHMRKSQQGQLPTSPVPHTCSCDGIGVMKQVTAVYMDRLDYVQLHICPCAPAPVQLVKWGLFPCSPVYPALAVSLDMLEFVSTLFVHLAPNETAWADALTSFLARQGHVFKVQDSLCQRFVSALGQYQVLVCIVTAEMDKQISVAWHVVLSRDPADRGDIPPETIMLPIIDDSTPITNRLYISALSPDKNSSRSHAIAPPVPNPNLHTCSNTRSVLSDYLHSWCPLCFGGDVSGGGKLFLEIWKARVEEAHPGNPARRMLKKGEYALDGPDADDDIIEAGLHVPNSSLNICGESFIAADGDRVKTPGECFSDTGVMAGQSYALALIDAIMAELPTHWRVGILYDIGCQIHHSILKWNLLPWWIPQIVFGISVFHAYCHQWVCQLWYNPQKGGVWGLTDGEGCECLWNDLQHLIPNLCVTGFHRRLFVLDLQIEHLDHLKMQQAGVWLEKTASLPELTSRATIKEKAQDLVEALQKQLIAIPVSDTIATRNKVGEITSALAEQEKVVSCLSKQEDDLTAILKLGGLVSYDNLKKMKDHPWFEHQLNMRVLKACILAKACQRNFKAHNLTGAFRSKALDHSTVEHMNKAFKCWYQSIKNLVTDYNKRRLSMIKLRRWHGIPHNAVIPPPIEMKGLFSLDVDNDIWQDIGLADDEFGGQVPPWLGDEDVRNGIQIVQEIMNCHDELYLCECERSSLQHWFNDELAALITVLQASKDLGKRWGCSIDALAPNVAQSVSQSEVSQSEVGQSGVGQSRVGQSRVGQSEVGQSEVGQSKVTQSEVAQSEVAQSEVTQSEVAQSEVAQSKVTQSEVAQSEVAQSEVAQSKVAQSKVTQSKVTQSKVAQSKLAGSLAEQAAIQKLPRSDKWTVGPGEGEVDSSDDDEEFELEPWPVIADPVLLAATDLLHEGHSDDMGSETSSDEE
ncbi:hypothetical protein BS47DRAFT_1368124 [Hydnum rufescens UP504]|uniref:CxC1-like cysteine cluster associated with KDZ transposases domain-containing protein n=1 Tax=Hydnum rufescens UP504 TaxID=1448309 RepID=A0A9P6DNN3_9AGAM|nr:hypothetical protein BS47DRAFT_1368124 [Hydnum rufescens UP504]